MNPGVVGTLKTTQVQGTGMLAGLFLGSHPIEELLECAFREG